MTSTRRSATVEWRELDATVRTWWDIDVVTSDRSRELGVADAIWMPRGYVAGGTEGSPAWYSTMFSWDAYFSNMALMVHSRIELVRDAIDNYLTMIERFGYMPNGNQLGLSTRSQTPIFPDSIQRYLAATQDEELAARAYPLLVGEYRGYWMAEHHSTPTGLVTNRDLGDPNLDPRLAAEAETGLDWTPLYDGDVRDVAPVITNTALVRYAQVLAQMSQDLGRQQESDGWQQEAAHRAELIRRWCWSEQEGFFYDYHHREDRLVRGAGATGFWAMWAGVATPEQARRCVDFIPRLLHDYGLTVTESAQASPYPDLMEARDVQWMYPAGWAPLQIIAVCGLDAYGYSAQALDLADRFLQVVIREYTATGRLYEKYNVVDGSITLPNDRYGTIPLHGWTSAAAVLLGRRVHERRPISEQVPWSRPVEQAGSFDARARAAPVL